MQGTSKTHLRVEGVTVTFPGVRAVDDVSLEVNPGEFFSLLGPSGCGKTTLLRTIAGFYKQQSGSIYFNDTCIDRIPAHKRDTAMVFQQYALFPHLTVWDNVGYGLRARKIDKATAAKRIQEALELVDLAGYEKRKPAQLSGGQQQRVAVARAIVTQPRILLMDEPLANLDAKLRFRLRTDLRQLQKRLGITTIYVTHDQEEAMSLSDRIAVMFNGKIAQVGTPEEISQDPHTRAVAEFVAEGNFFDAKVVSWADGRAEIALASGHRLIVPVQGPSLPKDAAATVSFRPHEVRLVPGGATANGQAAVENIVTGHVVNRMYLGDAVRYEVEIGSDVHVSVEHYASADVSIREGETVTLSIPSAHIKLFAEDGARVGR